jgi:hypothetical protein
MTVALFPELDVWASTPFREPDTESDDPLGYTSPS